jgi:cytochrome c
MTKYQMENLVAGVKYDPADVGPGTLLYVSSCATCHGVRRGQGRQRQGISAMSVRRPSRT